MLSAPHQLITTPKADNTMYVQQRDEYLESFCKMATRKISVITIFGTMNNSSMKIDHFQLGSFSFHIFFPSHGHNTESKGKNCPSLGQNLRLCRTWKVAHLDVFSVTYFTFRLSMWTGDTKHPSLLGSFETIAISVKVLGKHPPKPVKTCPFLTTVVGQRLQVAVQQST